MDGDVPRRPAATQWKRGNARDPPVHTRQGITRTSAMERPDTTHNERNSCMRTHYLTFGMTLLMLASVVGTANAKTQHVNCTFASSFTDGVETNIDTDGDGLSATLNQGINNC